jgi:hypothetical protein
MVMLLAQIQLPIQLSYFRSGCATLYPCAFCLNCNTRERDRVRVQSLQSELLKSIGIELIRTVPDLNLHY